LNESNWFLPVSVNMKFIDPMNVRRRWPVFLMAALLAGESFFTPAQALETDVRRDAVVQAVEKVMPSVVNIATASVVPSHDFYDPIFREFFGIPRRREQISVGSGVIIDEEGYILTNLHVLRRATRVQVKLWDGRVYDAEPLVVYTTQKDVALLKLRTKPGETFKAIKFAADDDLLLGETVLALGNPFGLGGSVSRGILSSKTRREPVGDEPLDIADWLQTDAAINPGNSGGPLINLRGELIGLNVAVGQGQGIGFAIPIKQVSAALSDFFTPELLESLWFGARLKAGILPLTIASVQPGSPAHKAGLSEGQQILQVNGESPRSLADFARLVGEATNRNLALQVQRGGERTSVRLKLIPFDELIEQKVGLTLLTLTPQMAASFGNKAGLYIEGVEKDGPADRAQVQRGFLLTGIDGQDTENLATAALVLSTKQSGDRVQLSVVVPRRRLGYVEFRQGTITVQVR
jgi:S1-C subfamily serine protease